MVAPSPVPLSAIVKALSETLCLDDFANDVSHNGLQVEGAPDGVRKICCGVDATPAFYERARACGAQLLIVHHGISWGTSLSRISGENYRLVAPLIRSGTALFAAHLPLDAHPQFGNNAQLCKALGLLNLEPFAQWHGFTIGWKGSLPEPIRWTEMLERLAVACPDAPLRHVDSGPEFVQRIGIVSGGCGAEEYRQAAAEGLDAFITGEMNLAAYHAACLHPVHYAAAGHYATERFGVRAITEYVADRFGLPWEMVDFHLPY